MKTLAQLKRDAKEGKLSLEMIEWYGKTGEDIPTRLQGVRKVTGANTVALMVLNADGEKSELRLDSANLIEYSDDALVVYTPGYRDLTENERKMLDAWEAEQKAYLERYPMADTYWQKKKFFEDRKTSWLLGYDMVHGKKYIAYKGKVMDRAVKGDAILRYKVHTERRTENGN